MPLIKHPLYGAGRIVERDGTELGPCEYTLSVRPEKKDATPSASGEVTTVVHLDPDRQYALVLADGRQVDIELKSIFGFGADPIVYGIALAKTADIL